METTTLYLIMATIGFAFVVGASVALYYLPGQVDRFALWWIDRRREGAKRVRDRLARPERIVARAVPVPIGAAGMMSQDDLDDVGTRTEEVRPVARRAGRSHG